MLPRKPPWEISRQSRQRYFVTLGIEREALDQPARVRYTTDPSTSEQGTDTHTLAYGRRVAVTPISIDLTSRTDLTALGELLSNAHGRSAA